MGDCLYICGHESGSGRVWRFKPGDTVLTDISDATLSASARIECVEWDSVNRVLYAGTADGKILKYTGGAWAVEYDTGSAIPILSVSYFEGYWYALRSYRPMIDAGTGITVYRQTAPGTWVSVYSTASPQRACSLHPAPLADDGPHLLMGTVDTGYCRHSTDGSTWATEPGLSQGSDPIECFWYDRGAGVTQYLVRNTGNGNHWSMTPSFGGSWTGWGDGGSSGSTYGPHSAVRYVSAADASINYFFVDYTYHRVYRHKVGVGWIAGYEADLPGAGANQRRSAFAEIGGALYVCDECAAVGSLHHRDDTAETWSRDIDTADMLMLDMVTGEELGLDRRRYSTHLHACGPGR